MNSPDNLLTKAQKLRGKPLKEAYGQQKRRHMVQN
jgi:hypothetical protein